MRSSKFEFMLLLAVLYYPIIASSENPYTEETATACDTVGINYKDNPELTRTEKLALMEKALYESLNRFEDCVITPSISSSSSNDSSTANVGGGSVADDTMRGTEVEESEVTSPSASTNASSSTEGSGVVGSTSNSNNGKIPEDIPPAANDDAIAAQIRAAAEAETDPDVREKLWDEYRNYKGISSD